MTTIEKITSEATHLRPEEQVEVLDFIEFLRKRHFVREEREWKTFSLRSAMRGMEDEPELYNQEDIREGIE